MNRMIKQGLVAGMLVSAVSVVAVGCLDRPVETSPPNLKTNFTAVVENKVIDKIDILFDIDNSASMGDKQDYLKAAIPDLVNRLINPNCVDANGVSSGPSTNGTCTNNGDKPEFTPVHDLHLGIVSSSLGARGGDACNPMAMALSPFQNVSAHNDDQAHLLNRSLTYSANNTSVTEGTVADAPAGDPYLYWYPSAPNMGMTPGPGTVITNPTTLVSDFTELVGGTGVFGCGIESQLESWYRFLIQPDPYESIVVNNGRASWSGVDTTILQQRHDFLRPDSLVAIVVLSDENDSEIDVRSLNGLAFNWMATSFYPPKGTSICQSNPGSSSCVSCAQSAATDTDPNCAPGNNTYNAVNDWGYDLNLRHVHTMAKYGVDPQFPIQRYVNGLTSTTVPDRCGEYGGCANTPYAQAQSSYEGANDCQNPLFAGSLPDGSNTTVNVLCHPPPGPRTKDLVFYAHIGGVPYELLHFDPNSAANSVLTEADWVKILGNDPLHYDYTGIDPHMIEDYQPRAGLAPPGSANNADPINGHEWITNTGSGHVLEVDRQYACIFPLSDSSGNPAARDCTQPQNASFCDCPHATGTVTAQELPPVCGAIPGTPLPAGWTAPNDVTQTAAKAYPTIRELLLAKLMGNQGIVSSICPQHVADNATMDDPLYGYRPAVAVLVDRMKTALQPPCFPQALPIQSNGAAACRILVQVPGGASGTSGTCLNPICPAAQGLDVPDQDVMSGVCQGLENDYSAEVSALGTSAGLTDPANVPVCELQQLVNAPDQQEMDFQGGTCASGTDKGWCYVTGDAAAGCPRAIVFSTNAVPAGATVTVLCDP